VAQKCGAKKRNEMTLQEIGKNNKKGKTAGNIPPGREPRSKNNTRQLGKKREICKFRLGGRVRTLRE